MPETVRALMTEVIMNGSKRMSMKRYIKYLFVPVILSAAAGCIQIEEEQFEEREPVQMTFKAVMEGDQTKTEVTGLDIRNYLSRI